MANLTPIPASTPAPAPSSILGGLVRGFFSLAWIESLSKGFHGGLDGVSCVLSSKIVSLIPPARGEDTRISTVNVSELGKQVLQQINEAYPSHYELQNNFCLLFVMKPESWQNLSDVLQRTIQKLRETEDEDSRYCNYLEDNVTNILLSVTQLIKDATLLPTETKDVKTITRNPYFQQIDRSSTCIKGMIDDLLGRVFSPSASGLKHCFSSLREYWESYEQDLYRFKKWADIDLLAQNSLEVRHSLIEVNSMVPHDDALEFLIPEVRNSLPGTRYHSIYILGIKEGKCDLADAFFYSPNSSSFSRSLRSLFMSSTYHPPYSPAPISNDGLTTSKSSIQLQIAPTPPKSVSPPILELVPSSMNSSPEPHTDTSIRPAAARSVTHTKKPGTSRSIKDLTDAKKSAGTERVDEQKNIVTAVHRAVHNFNKNPLPRYREPESFPASSSSSSSSFSYSSSSYSD